MPTAEVAAAAAAAVDSANRSTQSMQALKLSKRWKSFATLARNSSARFGGDSGTDTTLDVPAAPGSSRGSLTGPAGGGLGAPEAPAGGLTRHAPSKGRRVSIVTNHPQFLHARTAPAVGQADSGRLSAQDERAKGGSGSQPPAPQADTGSALVDGGLGHVEQAVGAVVGEEVVPRIGGWMRDAGVGCYQQPGVQLEAGTDAVEHVCEVTAVEPVQAGVEGVVGNEQGSRKVQ